METLWDMRASHPNTQLTDYGTKSRRLAGPK